MNKLFCCLVLALPLHRLSVTSGFGWRVHPVTGNYDFHAGVDLRARHDTVFAVTGGRVSAGYNVLLGNYIRVTSGDLQTVYGHLSQIFRLTGDSVQTDDAIAITGCSGRVTGEHLHFAVCWCGHYINPLQFLLYAMQQLNLNRKENKQ